jgi:hypothetical protein
LLWLQMVVVQLMLAAEVLNRGHKVQEAVIDTMVEVVVDLSLTWTLLRIPRG